MKIDLSWFLLLMIILLYTSKLGVFALNIEGTTLLSLVRHWKVVPSSIKSSWNSSHSTPCSWLGVHCNHHSLVDRLNLFNLGISGQLGPEIAYLKHLKSINLSQNTFSGSIPLGLGNCSLLESLELSENNFSGVIPESLGFLSRLLSLSLWSNSLSGEIPDSLFRIPHLREIYLFNNMLSGSIPLPIGNLSELTFLYLNNNQLSGTIPSSVGNCSELQELYLNDNLLEGELPYSLNNLVRLTSLYIENNNLEGRIPLDFGNYKELQLLVLSNNRFVGGVPRGLGNCSKLTNLSAVNCGLSGRIPSSLGQLTELTLLYLSDNHLSGPIPRELGNCKALTDLQVYGNHLEGVIPSELGMLDHLQTLMLFTNNLSGEIPKSIFSIQTLQHFLVYGNNLGGEIPKEITELKQLRNISLFDNRFTGNIPQGLGLNSSLMLVDFTRNKFTGPIPPNLCFKKKLRKLLLGQNHFRGIIPSDIGSCFSLTRLILKQNNLTGELPDFVEKSNLLFVDLSNNSLSGSIPSSLRNLAKVTSIDLSLNNLTGNIPTEIGNLLDLEHLNLSHNSLEGVLPLELSSCRKLSRFDASYNVLNGTIPSNLRNLVELSSLDLSKNRIGGSIPTSLFQMGKLSFLHLGENQLEGNIPPSIGLEFETQSLRSLNFSSNRLTGSVPKELGKLKMLEQLDICCNNLSGNLEVIGQLHSLTEVNVSYNSFAGPIPSPLVKFVISSPSSFIGNSDICIDCRVESGVSCQGYNNNNTFKSCNTPPRKRGLRQVDIAMIVSGTFLFALILLLGVSYVLLRHKGHERNLLVSSEEGASSLLNQVTEATENLNDKYIIGRGAHGVVYKVTLGPTKVYALKKIGYVGSKGGNKSMVREIQTIGKVRHRNLVRMEDFWLRKDFGLILYGYMKNGSLYDVLHGADSSQPLEWEVRCKIALGTAQGLSYLHFDCDPAIVHRDIKPMNILLDSDLEPHISDFGIAKLLEESVASMTSSKIQGTIGYMAPENAFSTRSSKACDVYAYGVVLLELITRKKALDPSFGGEVDIVGWAKSTWNKNEDKIEKIVDLELVDEFVDSRVKEQVREVLLIALSCTEKEAIRRPSMRYVVKQLLLLNDFRSPSKHALT
ncbi:hypothetical protein ABFS82_09G130400 [Erythranthe guttata]|nr:PREDICTED: receptor-like protein kinase [Erythranthe guttata]|eukprot:XP_012856549.1 PREDICTED: receptor-like protein kinase [Erythranthe guttata]